MTLFTNNHYLTSRQRLIIWYRLTDLSYSYISVGSSGKILPEEPLVSVGRDPDSGTKLHLEA